MTKKEENIIESLLTGGIIGATLGALIHKSKGRGAAVGAIAGAAILGSAKAYENAQQTNVPVLVEEGTVLYELHSDGTKKIIKELPKSKKDLPKNFTLK